MNLGQDTETLPPGGVRIRRALLPVCLFLVTMTTGAQLLNRLPSRLPSEVRPCIEYLQRNGEEIDTVFLGSSAILRHVIPARFDETMARLGIPVHSVNLGVQGMGTYELDAMLREVLALELPNLKYVFLDAQWTSLRIPPPNQMKPRTVWWHNLPTTGIVLKSIMRSDFETREKLSLAWMHFRHMVRRTLNIGNGYSVLATFAEPFSGSSTNERALASLREERGFVALRFSDKPTGHRAEYLTSETRNAKTFAKATEELRESWKQPVSDTEIAQGNPDLVKAQVASIMARGAQPIHVFPPYAAFNAEWQTLERKGFLQNLISMNQPDRFPELYDSRYRYDYTHLERAGAEFYTDYLAREAAALLLRNSP